MKRLRKGANSTALAAADAAIMAANRADANNSLDWYDVVEIAVESGPSTSIVEIRDLNGRFRGEAEVQIAMNPLLLTAALGQ